MKKLGLGMMRLPVCGEEGNARIDETQVCQMADRFLSSGFVYVDTAYPYHMGMSEEAVRHAFTERYPRDAFVLADKMPTWLIEDKADYPRIFAEQLARCGVTYFDYYLLHNLGEKNYAITEQHDGFAFLRELKAQGKARNIGFSFHDRPELLDAILSAHPEADFVQLQINYADWENQTIQSRACYETALKHGKPVIVMEPVKGGVLAKVPPEAQALFEAASPGKSAASWAIRYAASLPGVMMVLSGMSNLEQLADNMATMDEPPLTKGDIQIIEQVSAILNAAIAVPCTACRYCLEECPQNIAIPQYFSLYNNHKQSGNVLHTYYENLTHTHGRAADCIACRRCEGHCPQHIAISERMSEVSALFDEDA